MALPADFNKIFASTATGGITPPSDLNYAKGWEWIGANPPEKNDFNYLQNLSDLKAKWLYNYTTTTSNASSRTIGSGLNQVPDMSLFGKGIGYFRLPNGKIVQYFQVSTSASAGVNPSYPIPFPSTVHAVFASAIDVNVPNWVSASNFNNSSCVVSAYDGNKARTATSVYILAIGE